MLTNINDKVINERLKIIDKYKNNILATVTHDLRTPLNGMQSLLQASMIS